LYSSGAKQATGEEHDPYSAHFGFRQAAALKERALSVELLPYDLSFE